MSKRKKILGADLFCGAGGTSQGLLMAANQMKADLELLAINHWQVAIDTHSLNHPEAQNLCTGVDVVDPLKLVPGGRLDILCASPECTHHSVARGGKPMNDQSRASAWHILRWAQVLYIDNLIIENVPEFQSWGPLGANGRPMKSKRGELFQLFVANLKGLGYKVDYRILNCADYGAPTTRRRLFLIARRGNKKIVWPEPTHVPPVAKGASLPMFAETRLPWRTAREIIDWSRESKDIFDRKKPLAPNTLRRISAGMLKFNGIKIDLEKCVREGLRPYLVVLRGTSSVASVDDPLPTVTNSGAHYGLVQPFLLPHRAKDGQHDVDEPFRTVTATSSDFAIVEPFTMQIDQTGGNGTVRSVDSPLGTVVTKANTCVVEPFILGQQSGSAPRGIAEPVPTIATGGAIGITEPFLAHFRGNHAGKEDGNGRHSTLDQPLPTQDTSNRFALAEPFVVPQFSGADARSVSEPLGTVTTTSRGVGLAEGFLVPNFGEREGQTPRTHSLDDPAPAVTSHGAGALVQPFLAAAGGTEGQGRNPQSVDAPLGAVLTNDRRAVCEPFLATVTHQGGDRVRSVDMPMATVTRSMGDGVAQPYLVEYYGQGGAESVDEPMPTVVTKDRFGLTLPQWIKEGDLVYRLEIRFRMLQPRELARAQGFDDDYQFSGNREAVVKQIGNAVPPPMAAALCGAVLA
jgi:DNA (cytosine-5)-methyltransferase 1